jgi:hypothetical protein
LHAAGPLEDYFGAAIWAVRDGLRHRGVLGCGAGREVTSVARRPLARHFVRTDQAANRYGLGRKELL